MEKKKIQPIFLENLTLSFAGYKIKRFAHHKHSDQSDKVTPHKHAHSQFLLYLRGRGIQTTGLSKQPVMRGSFLYFPPQTLHGFIKSMESPPLSLVFDFKEKNPLSPKPLFKSLPPAVLSEIERTLHHIIHSADLEEEKSPRMAAQILSLFAVLHDSLRQRDESNPKIHPVTSKIRRLLAGLSKAVGSPRELANLLGEDLSSLNRKVRNESGLNLGTFSTNADWNSPTRGSKQRRFPYPKSHGRQALKTPTTFRAGLKKESGKVQDNGRPARALSSPASTFYSPCLSASSASERYFLFLDFRNPMRFRRSLGDKVSPKGGMAETGGEISFT